MFYVIQQASNVYVSNKILPAIHNDVKAYQGWYSQLDAKACYIQHSKLR